MSNADQLTETEQLRNLLDNTASNLGYAVSSLKKAAELIGKEYNEMANKTIPQNASDEDMRLLREWVSIASSFSNIYICERCKHLYAEGYVMGDCVCDERLEGEAIYGEDLLPILD